MGNRDQNILRRSFGEEHRAIDDRHPAGKTGRSTGGRESKDCRKM